MGGDKRKSLSKDPSTGGKKGKYFHQTKKDSIPLGSCGFLVTCETGREYKGAREIINLLTEYYEKLEPKPTESKSTRDDKSKNIDALIAEEVEELKDRAQQPLTYIKTGISGLLYIKVSREEGNLTPADVAQAIMKEVSVTKQSKSRFCMRVLPVEVVCSADYQEIKHNAARIVAPHFPDAPNAQPVQFAVQFEHRASKSLERLKVIDAVVASIKQPPHKVNLNAPEKTVVVQLVKNYCLMGVAAQYRQYAKYNMKEMCRVSDDEEGKGKTGQAHEGGDGQAGVAGKEEGEGEGEEGGVPSTPSEEAEAAAGEEDA